MYILKFTDAGLMDVRALPKPIRNFLKKELQEKVAEDPVGCSQELSGVLRGWRSFHCGEYRVIYKVYDDLRAVAIAGIGKHDPDAAKDVYRRLENLANTGKLANEMLIAVRGFSLPPAK